MSSGRNGSRTTLLWLAAAGLLWLAGGSPAQEAGRDAHETLNAVLWMQRAAEYRMVADQVYGLARLRLDQALADANWTAATEQLGQPGYEKLPPAVILDIDETVLDNSPYQAQLVFDRRQFDADLWRKWAQLGAAADISGAVSFVLYARQRGVQVFFITNRSEADEPASRRNLQRAGIEAPAAPDCILSLAEGAPADKSPRRKALASGYRILLLVGDDLGDFLSVAGLSADERLARAEERRSFWGSKWIVLPNPAYGSWEKAFYPDLDRRKGEDDAAILARKRGGLVQIKGE